MAASTTQIANLALSKLGQKRIDSLSDSDPEAIWANELYGTARDYVTSLAPWRHAKSTVSLAETTNTRSDDYAYAYTRPSDCLQFLYVLEPSGTFDPRYAVRFECEGDLIFTDTYQARGVYVKQATDVTKFPPPFTDAVAWYLAHLLVQPMRMENRLVQFTADGFQRALSLAVAKNGMETNFIVTADEAQPDWLTVRG